MRFAISSPRFVAALIMTFPMALLAATHYVNVNSSGFSPSSLTIEVGDEVVWVNTDDTFSHTTTGTLPFSNPDYWNAILIDQFDAFAKTFNNLGTFAYSDQLDTGTGSITVIAAAPTGITLAAPQIVAGQFVFSATGLTAGKSNVLQSSTNLTSWTSIRTNVATSSTMTFTNTTSLTRRFFRLYEVP